MREELPSDAPLREVERGGRFASFPKLRLILFLAVALTGWWICLEKPREEKQEREYQASVQIAAKLNETLAAGRTALAEKKWNQAREQFEAAVLIDANCREATMDLEKIKEHLASARGGLLITTQPPGAFVQVGGLATGKTTAEDARKPGVASFPQLPLGKYPVKIESEDYEPCSLEMEVKENEFTESGLIVLRRGRGMVAIGSMPTGLPFELMDSSGKKQLGVTPAIISTLTGFYILKMSRPGWHDYATPVW
jgi:hypothetical protein